MERGNYISFNPIPVFEATARLRWARSSRTTMEPDRLQQAFREVQTGEIRWHDVPVEIIDPAAGNEKGHPSR